MNSIFEGSILAACRRCARRQAGVISQRIQGITLYKYWTLDIMGAGLDCELLGPLYPAIGFYKE